MRIVCIGLSLLGGLAMVAAAPIAAQVRTIDPNQGIDSDLGTQPSRPAPRQSAPPQDYSPPVQSTPPAQQPPVTTTPATPDSRATQTTQAADTFERDDLMAAGEGVFGKGLRVWRVSLNASCASRAAPRLYRRARGVGRVRRRPALWLGRDDPQGRGADAGLLTGPSLGFDIGGDANKVFVLVYNLYDTEELFHRFPAAEGRLYFVGGFAATYLRRGNVVLIPVRLGVGWRAGVNVGYMNFTHKARWLPF